MMPGLTNTLPVQQHIVENLKKKRVRCVVRYSGFEWIHEPNASSESSGVTYLDDFIHANFRLVQQFGDYAIWMNEREPAPAAGAHPGGKDVNPDKPNYFRPDTISFLL